MAASGRALVLSGLLCLATADGAAAGAFTLDQDELKLFVTGLLTSGDRYFDRRGRLRSRGDYRKYDLQAFAEYGLRDGFTVFGSTALQKIRAEDGTTYRRKGLGRSEIGARARLWTDGAWIVSVQGSAVIAGAKKSDDLAVIGETDDQADGRVLVARSFELFNRPAFVDVAAGYRFRSGDPADEIRLDATFGIRPTGRLLLLAQSFNQIGAGRWSGPYRLKQRIHKLQGAVLFDLTERLQLVSAAFFSPAGRDSLDEKGATIGLGFRF